MMAAPSVADDDDHGQGPRRWRSVGEGVAAPAILAMLAIVAALAWPLLGAHSGPAHFADADDVFLVKRGRLVYRERCASCHGRNLEGQPLWRLADQYAGRRAPALNQTGLAWQRPDEQLFDVIKYGKFADAPDQTASSMPAFKNVLDDQEILAVSAFIKASWPTGFRVLQATRNPGQAGMPPGADRTGWTLPPNCMAVSQQGALARLAH